MLLTKETTELCEVCDPVSVGEALGKASEQEEIPPPPPFKEFQKGLFFST